MNSRQLKIIKKRHDLIPGGAHTYSRGDDQFPANAPKVILKGEGAYVWGEDGKKYLDWCMGLRAVSLGHGYKPVDEDVIKQIKKNAGSFSRPSLLELELADLLVSLLPNVDMVKFTKNGSTATTAATKLARAHTGRKYIAVCSSHAFFSYDDWFIGTTPCDSGIPKEIKKLTVTFRYNDIESVKKLFKKYPGEIACVIMEAVTTESPVDNFLKEVQKITRENGAVFILDEMITGFRFDLEGAQKLYKIKPDLITYGKGIANGYSLAVLGGSRKIMELGGLRHKKERVFLVSTTHGAELLSLVAAMSTIKEIKRRNVIRYFWEFGGRLKAGLNDLISKYNLGDYIEVLGFAPNLSMSFKDISGQASFLLKTIFLQEIIKRGVLFQGYFAVSYSHREPELAYTLKVFDQVFKIYASLLKLGPAEQKKHLRGHILKPVFRKYN